MSDVKESRLGEALTSLNLENLFLSDEELTTLPLPERGRIVNDIISKKLKLGKWSSVIEMIFGGFGKADALYDGDRNQLKSDILNSAKKNPSTTSFREEIARVLLEKKEYYLLYELANVLPLNYGQFLDVTQKIPKKFFLDSDLGKQRAINLENMCAEKALAEREYGRAIGHYKSSGNLRGLSQIFDTILAQFSRQFSRSSYNQELEELIETDESQRATRVKRVIESCKTNSTDAEFALKLYIQYNPRMTRQERKAFYEKIAKNLSSWDIINFTDKHNKPVALDPKLKIIWAKQHVKDEPRTAYVIFTGQGYRGRELVQAVNAGLELAHSYQCQVQGQALTTKDVQEAYLKAAYTSASFEVRIAIAKKLGDTKKLQILSRQANSAGKFETAYMLWGDSGASYEGKYINQVRAKLIRLGIDKHDENFYWLSSKDKAGQRQVFDALVQEANKNVDLYFKAYKKGLEADLDPDTMQIIRKKLVLISPSKALKVFRGNEEKLKDPVGFDYVIGVVAEQTNVDKEKLRKIVEKYQLR